ncbi:MAG TPA: Hpt domain-containing protein, partial [Actinomycetota bacterium]|nr:Hpt domain-containing protein [Actinomycetota bacterium]
RRLAHSLKSNAATFGAAALSGLARRLETSALEGDRAAAVDLVPAVREEFERVRAELEPVRGG